MVFFCHTPSVEQHHQTFEGIRRFDADGNEFWMARQLAKVLEYSEYRHFLPVVERAKEACHNSGHPVADHFEDVLDMVDIGSGAKRRIANVHLSRYGCYLIVQNGDPVKPVIANGQTYFALQTRRQELSDDESFARLTEDEKRLAIRNELAWWTTPTYRHSCERATRPSITRTHDIGPELSTTQD